MDVHKLWDYREYVNVNGAMLTSENITLLQNSLTLLQNDNHFKHIHYWGQIFGINTDYHIAVGINEDLLKERKYFYTTNMEFWNLLPSAKKKYRHLCLLASTPFIGDPTVKIKVLDESLEEDHPDKCKDMKEEARLASTISNINDEAEICARGQLLKRPDGTIIINNNFYGLSTLESKQLKSYLHVRQPQHRWNTNLLTRADYNYSMDFLDTIDMDIPNGCWNLSLEHSGTVVYLKNLYWLGMTYFHKVKTPDAGFCYIGNGRKNWDVPFLL